MCGRSSESNSVELKRENESKQYVTACVIGFSSCFVYILPKIDNYFAFIVIFLLLFLLFILYLFFKLLQFVSAWYHFILHNLPDKILAAIFSLNFPVLF